MMLDDDPLFAEWSNGAQTSAPQGSLHFAHSLAPHELAFEDDEPIVRVSPERREKLQRYVKATVAGCVALCLAAVVRVEVTQRMNASEDVGTATAAASPPPTAPAPELPSPPALAAPVAPAALPEKIETAPAVASPASLAPLEAPKAAPDAPAPVRMAETTALAAPPSASPPSQAISAAPSHVAPVAPVAPVEPKTAVQEREAARRALEHGKPRDAVAAGERATSADPTDAEAWLILGAAHQELGHDAAARAAFHSCLTSAKHGPIRECGSMLR